MAQQNLSSGTQISHLVDSTVAVITIDGRVMVGILRGYDQVSNLILDECHERVFSSKAGVEQLVLGLYVIRGDNVAVIGELNEELDSQIDFDSLYAQPLKPLVL